VQLAGKGKNFTIDLEIQVNIDENSNVTVQSLISSCTQVDIDGDLIGFLKVKGGAGSPPGKPKPIGAGIQLIGPDDGNK
jgi:hypothetical protein